MAIEIHSGVICIEKCPQIVKDLYFGHWILTPKWLYLPFSRDMGVTKHDISKAKPDYNYHLIFSIVQQKRKQPVSEVELPHQLGISAPLQLFYLGALYTYFVNC